MYNGDTKEFSLEENTEESFNEIKEIRYGEEIESLEDEIINNMEVEEEEKESPKKKKKNIFKAILNKWNKLSKKNKIIAIVIGVVILIAIIITLVLVFKKNPDEEVIDEPVVLEADNYRYENGKLFFLNQDGKDIGSYSCQNKKETLCYVAYSSNEDNFDVTTNVYEKGENNKQLPVNKRMSIINENYVFIYDNDSEESGSVFLHSIKENADYESYELVKEYDLEDNYVVAKNEEGNYGLLLFNGDSYEEVIDFKYDYLGVITENKETAQYLVAKKADKWYLIDYKGNEKTKAINDEIKNYSDSLVSVKDELGEYHLYDFKNNLVSEESYDYINFVNEYVLLVKNKELFITDLGLNKLYEEGIKIPNTTYNKLNIFNKKTGKLTSNEYSFGISVNNTTIELTLNKNPEPEVKLINTLESVVSANYENINYFDGKLYIYSDAEKTELLGTYTCNNKNNITTETSELDNCYFANNSEFSDNDMSYKENKVGILPVFNNRFVFIKDVPELSNEETINIVLYDLKDNKKIGTYRAVDANFYNGNTSITFAETTGSLLLVKNTKNYYGILKVNLSSIDSLETVKFNDKNKNIEKIKDNYIIEKSNGSYYMINSSGATLTSEFTGKIMGYNENYIKAKNGDHYAVYNYEAEKVSEKQFKYVELYDSFYAGVDSNNKVNLYKYDDQTPIYETSITLIVTSNYRDGKSFAATIEGSKYKITVYDTNGEGTDYYPPEKTVETTPELNTDTETEDELGAE